MLHAIGIVLFILPAWVLLGAVAVLLMGPWLRRGGDVPTGPASRQARAAVRGAGCLAILPYIIESTAREQKHRRRHG